MSNIELIIEQKIIYEMVYRNPLRYETKPGTIVSIVFPNHGSQEMGKGLEIGLLGSPLFALRPETDRI